MSGVVTKARQVGRANAAQFIASLSVFDSGWDSDFDCPVDGFIVPKQDNFDRLNNISVRSSNHLVAERTAKKLAMRKRYLAGQQLFTPGEEAEDAYSFMSTVVDPNDINRRLKWGYTPLIEAAVKGDLAECTRLKGLGADLTLVDNAGKMAWQKARDRGYAAIAKLLRA